MTKMKRQQSLKNFVCLYDLQFQNIDHLSDLVTSGRDRNQDEMAFAAECAVKKLAFRAERCFYLAKSYSLAGERVKAYSLCSCALSLAESAVKESKSMANLDQAMVEDLNVLCRNCRSNICIEHATGIMEKKDKRRSGEAIKALSNISLKWS